jgi:hypothetical protein
LSSCLTSKDTQDRIYRPTAFPLFMQVWTFASYTNRGTQAKAVQE